MDNEYQNVALKEYKLIQSLKHPRIVRMVETFVNQGRETIFMVMELI